MKNFDQRELPLLFDALKPFISPMVEASLAQSSNIQSASLESISTHAIDGPYHTGTLNPAQAPDFFLLNGTRTITGQVIIATSSAMPPFSLSAANQNQLVVGLRADSVNKQVVAGFGMTGGGTLTSNVTITLGNPTSLSSTSTNAVTSTSHSHVIDSSIARSAITISVSGLGLSGGGNLTANRTITLTSSSSPAGASILASDSSGNLTIQNLIAVSTITAGSDTDVTNVLGRAKIFSDFTDNAMFAHFDFATTSSYALRQTNAGQTLINAASGQTVCIRINNSDIVAFDSTNIIFSTGKVLKSSGYTSGWAGAGWRIDDNLSISGESFAEFDNLSIRGTLSVYELVINQIRATNGSLFVSSSAKIDSISGSDWYFEDPEGSNLCPFITNDLVIIQNVNVDSSTLVKRIVRRVTAVVGRKITVTAATGGPTDIDSPAVGDTVVRFGSSSNTARQGTIMLTSDMSNSPYMDVISGVTSWSDWTGGTKTKLRIGLLSGLSVGSANEYGIAASYDGFGTNNSYFKIGTAGAVQNNITSTWASGGTVLLTISATSGIDFTLDSVQAIDQERSITWHSGANTAYTIGGYSSSGNTSSYYSLPGITGKKSLLYLAATTLDTNDAQVKISADSSTESSYLMVKSGNHVSSDQHIQAKANAGAGLFNIMGGVEIETLNLTSKIGLSIYESDPGYGNQGMAFTIGCQALADYNTSEISNDIGSYNALMILGNKHLDNSVRRVNIYDHLYVGTRIKVGGTTNISDNLCSFVGQANSTASSISLTNTVWGNAAHIGFNAYMADVSAAYYASGSWKFYGSQYTGNVTAAGRISWDGNANNFYFAISETGLANGAAITTWVNVFSLSSDTFTWMGDSDVVAIIGRAKVGYAGFSDNAAFAHYDHMSSTNYALIQGSGGTTVLNGVSGGVINFRIANVATASLGTVGLKIGDNSAAAYPIDAFEDSSGAASDIIMSLERKISTTPANGMGGSIRFGIESSTTSNRDAGRIGMRWDTVTDASRAASGFLSAYYITTENVVIEWGSNSTGGMLGFYGATKQNKQTVTGSRAGNAALASVLTALANLGLITNSSTA